VRTAEERITNAKTGGQKGQKPERFDLLPSDQLAKVARLYSFGANKYADHNWRRGFDWSLSIGALERHLAAFKHGEDFDAESGCEHLTSVVFHALALLWFMDAHPSLDDRYQTKATQYEIWYVPEAGGWDSDSFRTVESALQGPFDTRQGAERAIARRSWGPVKGGHHEVREVRA